MCQVSAADNGKLSSLPRARVTVKELKTEVGISLWGLQAGWDSGVFSGVKKASPDGTEME